jgi:hypothetical protein
MFARPIRHADEPGGKQSPDKMVPPPEEVVEEPIVQRKPKKGTHEENG